MINPPQIKGFGKNWNPYILLGGGM